MAETTLLRLDDTNVDVANPADDVRGLMVVDSAGNEVGEVDGLLIDEGGRKVRFLEVGSGGFLGIGQEKRLIPVDAVTKVDDRVHIDKAREHVAGGSAYDPKLASGDYFERVYGYYGYPPYWMPGYVYPGYPFR
jgi:sporulation protein YlmC with PRC-barrel domain